jgi:hypothetical protein
VVVYLYPTANCVDLDPYAYTPKTSDLRWEIVLLRGEMPLNPSSAKICSSQTGGVLSWQSKLVSA